MQRIKNIIYDAVRNIAILPPSNIRKHTLLIVKTDEIGDYVLWRNVLPCIRNSERFKNYEITLCGNTSWKDLALCFDKEYADHFIWYDKKTFKSDMKYRFRFLKDIHKQGFETILNPIFSRSARDDDAVVRASKLSYKIGMQRNAHNILPFEENYDKGLYNELVHLPMTGFFEFERNRRFISEVLGQNCSVKFGFDTDSIPETPVKGRYAVIFPGSRLASRRWPIKNFVEVATYLHSEHKLEIVVAGSKADNEACSEFEKMFPWPCINLAMKTSLIAFIGLLKGAECLISIDTGSVHLAAAAGCRVYGIFNGSQYGRYAPYPAGVSSKGFHAIFPDELDAEPEEDKFKLYQYFSPYAYDLIRPEKIIQQLNLND